MFHKNIFLENFKKLNAKKKIITGHNKLDEFLKINRFHVHNSSTSIQSKVFCNAQLI